MAKIEYHKSPNRDDSPPLPMGATTTEAQMGEQELNKKLAEWAEIRTGPLGGCPNFTQSLDACFKGLVPKLIGYEISISNYKGISNHQAIVATIKVRGSSAIAETPALALCLAIEKLIDKGGL